MSENTYILFAILICALVTVFLRASAFLIFKNKTPGIIMYLGKVLPCAVMAMLVVYCLRNVSLASKPHGLPELISLAAVIVLHKIKHNTLLSILVGTLLYMLLVQRVFV